MGESVCIDYLDPQELIVAYLQAKGHDNVSMDLMHNAIGSIEEFRIGRRTLSG